MNLKQTDKIGGESKSNTFGILAGLASGTSVMSNETISSSESYSASYSETTNLKELEERLRRLERRLYKLIERVELLERKAGVEAGESFF